MHIFRPIKNTPHTTDTSLSNSQGDLVPHRAVETMWLSMTTLILVQPNQAIEIYHRTFHLFRKKV